jgi:rhodanese-related sulfurtransferase
MKTVKVTDLSQTLTDDQGPRIIDLRDGDSYGAGHIPGALHIPMGRLSTRPGFVPDDRDVVVYCASGQQEDSDSSKAVQLLKDQGIEAAILEGGFPAWVEAGLPVEFE